MSIGFFSDDVSRNDSSWKKTWIFFEHKRQKNMIIEKKYKIKISKTHGTVINCGKIRQKQNNG